MKKKKLDATISLDYLQGLLSKEDLKKLEDELNNNGFSLSSQETQPRYIAGVEDFFPQIQVFLSPDLLRNLYLGLVTNAFYDGIKYFLVLLRQMIQKKKISKIQSGNVINNITPVMHFNIGQMHVILPMEIEDKKFEYFVDKAFETANANDAAKETYFSYCEKTGEVQNHTRYELIQKTYQESQSDDEQ